MSPRSSKPTRTEAKPDIYVGLLVVAVSALVIGIAFLAMELSKYGWQAAPGV